MDVITTAIIAALAALSKDAIKDSYNALKSALKKKFGSNSDIVDAVEELEKKPDSKGRQTTLQKEIENAKVNDDEEIVQLAQNLLNQLTDEPGGQQIINQTQTNTASGNSVSGDLNFSPVQKGIKKT
jgi:flagellar motor component MotA